MHTRCLSFHRRYQCRHSGACCTAGWPIPVEADRLARMRAAIASGRLRPPTSDPFVLPPDAPADAPALLAITEHRCVFYEPDARRCGVQRALDRDALPLACRQFPRVSIHDPRGVSVTLSHFCPTAASMLAIDDRVSIVTDAPAFPPTGEYVGLDATSSFPPLLRPDVLMDWDSWWAWERLSVETLTRADEPAALALGRLGWAVEQTRAWRPDDGSLLDRVRAAFDDARHADVRPFAPTESDLAARVEEVTTAIPEGLRPQDGERRTGIPTGDAVSRRFLAAHAFANWTAHQGRGLRTWLRSVEAPFVLLLSGLDVRGVDLRLRHLADPAVLARTWSRSEVGQQALGARRRSTPRP